MSILGNKLLSFYKGNIINQLSSASFRAISISPSSVYQKTLPQAHFGLPQNISNSNEKSDLSYSENRLQIFNNINKLLKSESENRLFAVVQLCGKQFKITQGDIILVEGYWPPTIGDRICLDKVLLAGSNDFTLIGCPILKPGICEVQATIIEKTLTHTKTHFRKKRRKQYMRINFYRSPNTMIRINSIQVSNLNDNSLAPNENNYSTKMF